MSIRTIACLALFGLLALALASGAARAEEQDPDVAAQGDSRFDTLFGGFAESHRFPGFAQPIAMPYLFEEPFTVTGIQAQFIRHEFPNSSVFAGGYANIGAVQARLAITDRISLIATRDGYSWIRPGKDSIVDDSEGWFDLAAGVKYAFYVSRKNDAIFSGGVRYRSHTGGSQQLDLKAGGKVPFQGHGDGAIEPFVSGGKGFGPVKLIANFGAEIPFDGDDNSTFLHYAIQANYSIKDRFLPLVSIAGITYISDGDEWPFNFEALDVGNLGSGNVKRNDVIWAGVGFRWLLNDHVSVGALAEQVLTGRKDIFDQRYSLSLSLEL